MSIEGLNEEEKERLMVDTGEDIQVERVSAADLPQAQTHEVLREEAGRDEVYQRLREAGEQGRKPKDRDTVPYRAIWEERGVKEELLRRGERIVIPEGQHKTDGGSKDGDTYLLANPGLVEAPDTDHSTTVPRTGVDRSAPKPLMDTNLPYTQHQRDDQHEDDGSGPIDKTRLDEKATGHDTPAGDNYLLAEPRLAEVPDDSTIVPSTGAEIFRPADHHRK